MISEPSSVKIKVISFFAAWSVVIWHSHCGATFADWFIPVVSFWSVPWFFLCSGFFLFNSWGRKPCYCLVAAKVKTILVPYVLWCVFGLVVHYLCGFIEDEGDVVRIFALTPDSIWPIYNRALWYVRCLIVFVVVGFSVRYAIDKIWEGEGRRMLLFSLLFPLVILLMHLYLFRIYGPGSSMFYFMIGILMRFVNSLNSAKWPRVSKITWMQTTLFVACICGWIILRYVWFELGYRFSSPGGNILNNCSTILFIVAIWFGLDYIIKDKTISLFERKGMQGLLSMSVFVYFFHSPPLKCFIDWVVPRLNVGWQKELCFASICIFYTPLCAAIGILFKECFPRMYHLLSGGR